MSEIWLVHAGCGKTTAASLRPDVLDFTVGQFKYLSSGEDLGPVESEQIKGTGGEVAPAWPWNYIDALYEEHSRGQYRHILSPAAWQVATALELGRPYIDIPPLPYTLVVPDPSLKDEYEQRYIDRGNPDDFLDIFVRDGAWERWQNQFESFFRPTRKIVLQSGQYLSDVLD